jgi:hypothetical protein
LLPDDLLQVSVIKHAHHQPWLPHSDNVRLASPCRDTSMG